MSGNHLFAFWDGIGKTKRAIQCLGREREIQEIIPVVWDGNRKPKISLPLNKTETGNFKEL